MSSDPSKLLRDALKLPPEARAALAGSLLESLDDSLDPDAEEEWEKEIARRIQELDQSQVKPVPWQQARRLIVGQ
jgi:putative addiction module component (TIGR02574 family)